MILFLSKNHPDSELVRVVVHQLLEQRILFRGYFEQQPLSEIPDDLETYPAVICGNSILRAATREERVRLEKYALSHTLAVVNDLRWPGGEDVFIRDPYVEIDNEVHINSFAAAAGVGNEILPPLPEKTVVDGMLLRIRDFFEGMKGGERLGEYHHHVLHAALALENSKYAPEGFSGEIDLFLGNIFRNLHSICNSDEMIAWCFAPLYAARTGDRSVAGSMGEALAEMIRRRPRTPQGLVANGGLSDDPLALRTRKDAALIDIYDTVLLRELTLNEMMIFGAALAAGTQLTGDGRFFAEAWKTFSYIERVHQDRDGLFFHVSRDGAPIGEKWGRGQGHALTGIYHMLTGYPDMPADKKKRMLVCLDRIGRGLAGCQREDGLWGNVLDNPASCSETSSAVIFTYVFAGACNRGWLDAAFYLPMIVRARRMLLTKFYRGFGSGNCRGTFPAFHHPEYYFRRPMHMCILPYIVPALLESAKLLEEA